MYNLRNITFKHLTLSHIHARFHASAEDVYCHNVFNIFKHVSAFILSIIFCLSFLLLNVWKFERLKLRQAQIVLIPRAYREAPHNHMLFANMIYRPCPTFANHVPSPKYMGVLIVWFRVCQGIRIDLPRSDSFGFV